MTNNAWPLAHETLPVVARVKTQTVTAAATVTSDIVDMKYWQQIVAYVNMGAYAAGNDGSLVCKFELSNDGTSFTSAVDATGKGITTATFTGSTGDEQMAVICLRNEECVVSGTEYRYARLTLTPTNEDLAIGAVVIGIGGRYQPGSDYDIAAVAEIIA